MAESLENRSPAGREERPDLDRPPESFAPTSTPLPTDQAEEPPSLSLMGRLFGVPLVIVGIMVGGALLVMMAFGNISADSHRSLDSLFQTLESSSGEKVAGVLLPRDRELWQDARELAMRLADPDSKPTAQELDQVVSRLTGLLAREPRDSTKMSDMGRQRLFFFMTALSHTGSGRAIDPLVARLGDASADVRREALISLGRLREAPGIHDVLPRVAPALDDADPVVRTVACWLMSLLATPSDQDVIAKLEKALLAEDREVSWNAGLALARLKNPAAKLLLLDMLDRQWWEQKVPVRARDANGKVTESPMPPMAVEQYLIAAVDAAANLDDADLRTAIEGLRRDPSPKVADRARTALENGEP